MPDNSMVLPAPIATLFQPIVEVNGSATKIHALECLTRGPRGTDIEGAVPLFDHVRRLGLEAEMDCACAANALRSVLFRGDERIAINVQPRTLERRDFDAVLFSSCAECDLDPALLIIEIGEHAPPTDAQSFQRAIAALRRQGARIAIDDVGYGYANFRTIIDCRPDYLKIDRYFVHHASLDPAKRAVIKSICDLAAHFGSRVIAEGVETVEDRDVLLDMGINMFQGFLYGRPVPMVRSRRRTKSRSERYADEGIRLPVARTIDDKTAFR